ncbi:restriction endonuclease subunit S [Candidatus Izimaplasma bacterium ZiA1]|nr:restriction endonuclease subunit S [Candidatus Izimaplasma bacterium ZiA1]
MTFADIYIKASEGGTPSTSLPEYYAEGSIPFIKVDDLENKYLYKSKDFITELGLSKSSAWIVPENSIIYSNGATIGNISISKLPISTKQGILGIELKDSILPEFVYYLMSSTYFKKEVHRITTRGTMKTVYIKDMSKISVPNVSFEDQKKLVNPLNSIDEKIEGFEKKLEILKQFNLLPFDNLKYNVYIIKKGGN